MPVASALTIGGYDLQPFPGVVGDKSRQPFSWWIPRVDLSKLDIIPNIDPDVWHGVAFDQFVSVSEAEVLFGPPKGADSRTHLPPFKHTLHKIALHTVFRASNVPPLRIFFISHSPASGQYVRDIVLVTNCTRHGPETNSVVLDAWIIPTTMGGSNAGTELSRNMNLMLSRAPEAATLFRVSAEEVAICKHILLASVQSCRSDWTHKPTCEYLAGGQIRIEIAPWKRPKCTCGEGEDLKHFPAGSLWLQ